MNGGSSYVLKTQKQAARWIWPAGYIVCQPLFLKKKKRESLKRTDSSRQRFQRFLTFNETYLIKAQISTHPSSIHSFSPVPNHFLFPSETLVLEVCGIMPLPVLLPRLQYPEYCPSFTDGSLSSTPPLLHHSR